MKCEVRGMNFFHNDDGRRRFVTLAFAEISWPELGVTLTGCRLVHYPDRGYRALPPNAKLQNGAMCVAWFDKADFAMSARDVMLEMYERMGGTKPEAAANNAAAKRRVAERKAKRQFIPRHELDVPHDATKEDVQAALETESEVRGVECYTEVFERKPEPVPVRTLEEIDMDVAEMGLSRPETAGLARTLGVA